jgi:hypothetical protein
MNWIAIQIHFLNCLILKERCMEFTKEQLAAAEAEAKLDAFRTISQTAGRLAAALIHVTGGAPLTDEQLLQCVATAAKLTAMSAKMVDEVTSE